VIQICRWQEECCRCFLKYNTLGLILGSSAAVVSASSAVSIICGPAAVLLVVASARTSVAWIRWHTATLVALSSELSDDVEEGFFYVDAVFGRGFDKVAAEVLGQCLSLLGGHLALGDAVALVANEHHRRLPEHWGGRAHWGKEERDEML
jgi:hypothetical protein